MNEQELLKKADAPNKLAEVLHPYYKGKIEVVPRVPVNNLQDFAIWYTPGVARSCMMIKEDIDKGNYNVVYDHTNKWNTVAVVSDGSRVLGLGNIGPEAGLPVMEGKALIFKYLGGVDAVPMCIDVHEPEEIINVVKAIQPNYGGINLEDISQPKCFEVLDKLRADKDVKIPVWHDDQQGTASITLAGLYNALKIVGKKIDDVKVVVNGAGAAGIAIARLLVKGGVNIKNLIVVDSKGILHPARADHEILQEKYKYKWYFAEHANGENRVGDLLEAVKGADALISAAVSKPGTIRPEHIKAMADDPIVFATANPLPEIWPWDAKNAGAKVVATGRSDFPNQINNSLGFPGIFRGTLDVRASTITDSMAVAAARTLAEFAEREGIHPYHIVPTMDDMEVFILEAVAVGEEAIKEGVARIKPSRQELYDRAKDVITRSHKLTKNLMKNKFIKKMPKKVREKYNF